MSNVRLTVYDALGKEVEVLVNQQLSAGTYEVDFDGTNLPSGVYYYILESEEFTQSKKMVLIK
jgi:flagellar hook assembly protein FlgD